MANGRFWHNRAAKTEPAVPAPTTTNEGGFSEGRAKDCILQTIITRLMVLRHMGMVERRYICEVCIALDVSKELESADGIVYSKVLKGVHFDVRVSKHAFKV